MFFCVTACVAHKVFPWSAQFFSLSIISGPVAQLVALVKILLPQLRSPGELFINDQVINLDVKAQKGVRGI